MFFLHFSYFFVAAIVSVYIYVRVCVCLSEHYLLLYTFSCMAISFHRWLCRLLAC